MYQLESLPWKDICYDVEMWLMVPVVLQGWEEIFNLFRVYLDWIPQLLGRIQIGMMNNVFNHIIIEGHFEVLEGCLHNLRGLKSWIPQCLHVTRFSLFGPCGELGSGVSPSALPTRQVCRACWDNLFIIWGSCLCGVIIIRITGFVIIMTNQSIEDLPVQGLGLAL